MTTVACVLRSGGPTYDARWVEALRRGVDAHLEGHRFRCLTNVDAVPDRHRVALEHGWPGWWSKLELFRPGAFPEGRLVVYMDLDTLVLGDLGFLAAYDGDLAVTRGFYRDVRQSAVIAFRPGEATRRVWREWIEDPAGHMRRHRGDGEWLDAHLPGDVDQLMDMHPGKIRSFKVHHRRRMPDQSQGVALLLGHGHPRFNDPAAGWAHRYWTNLTRATEDTDES